MNICVRPAVKISLINHLDLKSEAAYLAGQQAAGAPRPQPPGGDDVALLCYAEAYLFHLSLFLLSLFPRRRKFSLQSV